MHELSIALCILDAVAEEAARRGDVRIGAVHVKVGPLSGVIKEALGPAFDLAREGSDFPECRLEIQEVPIVIRCHLCQADRVVPSVQQMQCPVCQSPPGEIISGREMDIVAMEIYENEQAASPG